ncbi:MAG: ATP-dependent Clp protease adapter ClpS [Saezia sp.]
MGEESTSFVLLEQELAKSPPFYQVVMLNDDYTPMDFVVELLRVYFGKALEEATVIMLNIHHKGRGVCGVYPRDIAQTKVELVMSAAQSEQHPLQCIMEVL